MNAYHTAPSYLAEPTVQYLSQVIDDVKGGNLKVPEFQRGIVWTDEQRLELLRSVYSGMPIGSILVWRTLNPELKTIERIGSHLLPKGETRSGGSQQFLLDGLQRMTTLFGALVPPAGDYTPPPDEAKVNWNIFYDLQEQDFVLFRRRGGEPAPDTWIPTQALLDSVSLLEVQRKFLHVPNGDELIRRTDRLAYGFRNYKIPVIPIVTDNLEEVTKAFQRINSQGTPMSDVHMVNALTYSTEFSLQLKLEDAREELAEVGWESIDKKYLLATIRAFENMEISSPNAEQLSRTLKGNTELISHATIAMKRAARFLRNRCAIPTPAFLPYSYQAVLIADSFRSKETLPDHIEANLEKWLWITTYTSYFLGARGKDIREALDTVRAITSGRDLPLKDLHTTPVARFPKKFDFHGARAKAFSLLLASLNPLRFSPSADRKIDVCENFSNHGASALGQFQKHAPHSLATSYENRLIYPPEHLHSDLMVIDLVNSTKKVYESHAIDDAAFEALQENDLASFFQYRRANLERLEESFVKSLGLVYEAAPNISQL